MEFVFLANPIRTIFYTRRKKYTSPLPKKEKNIPIICNMKFVWHFYYITGFWQYQDFRIKISFFY